MGKMVVIECRELRSALRKWFAAVLTSVALVGPLPVSAKPPGKAGAALRIEAVRPSENPLLIRVALTMNADGFCIFDTFSPAAEGIADWIVLGPDGKRRSYRPVAKMDYRSIVRRLVRGDPVEATVDLLPGGEGEPYYDLSAPGTYRLRLVWTLSPEWSGAEYREWFPDCRPWSGSVASNTLNIRINGMPE